MPFIDTTACAVPCVDMVHFTSAKVGYLAGGASLDQAGNEALFRTGNGGRSWHRQPGGADGLAFDDSTVLRLVALAHCTLSCRYEVETARDGRLPWRAVRLDGPYGDPSIGVLTATSHDAYVQTFGHQAGGGDARSVLWSSTNSGASWSNRGEPCPQASRHSRGSSGEVDGFVLSAATDRSVAVACEPRVQNDHAFLIISTDGGASFRRLGPLPKNYIDGFAVLNEHTIISIVGDRGAEHVELSRDRVDTGCWWPVLGRFPTFRPRRATFISSDATGASSTPSTMPAEPAPQAPFGCDPPLPGDRARTGAPAARQRIERGTRARQRAMRCTPDRGLRHVLGVSHT